MSRMHIKSNIDIWYDLIGEGPLIVLNHGYGSSHLSLAYIAEYLKTDFQCLLWDQRGHGNSSKELGSNYENILQMYNLQQSADDCYLLLEKLGLFDNNRSTNTQKVYMYGHSMGGMVSQLYAIKYEKTLTGLALGSTTPIRLQQDYQDVLINMKNGTIKLDKEYYEENAINGFSASFADQYPGFVSEVVKDKMRVPKEIIISLMEDFLTNYDTTGGVSRLKIPVLVLHGEQDESIPFSCGQKLNELIPNSNFVVYPEQKHEINKEIPEKVANEIRTFFLGKYN